MGLEAQQNKFAVPGFEPGLPDSESGVLTTTLYRSWVPRALRSMPKTVFEYTITNQTKDRIVLMNQIQLAVLIGQKRPVGIRKMEKLLR
jgi:hypothetical protein